MEENVDAPDGVELDGDVDMETDGEDEDDEDQEKVMVDGEEEHEDQENGKEPRTIGQREILNPLADDAVTMADDQPTVPPQTGQEAWEHTPRPLPPVPAPRPQTAPRRPPPRTPETHTLTGLEFLELLSSQKPHVAAPTLRESEAAGNILGGDMEQQLPGQSACDDYLTNVRLADVPLPNVALHNVPIPDVPLPNIPLPNVSLLIVPLRNVPGPEMGLDSAVGEE